MIVAAYANETIEKEEERLVSYYLEAALFPEDMRETSLNLLKQGLTVDDLDLGTIDSPVLKKYLLELAVLVVSADNIITDSEQAFIDNFCRKLGISQQEAEASIFTVESFMYTHWQSIGYARHREEPDALRQHLLIRLKKLGKLYQKDLQAAIRRDTELHQLVVSARRNELRTDERKKIRQGLLAVLGQLPVFTPNTLPTSFLTYSVLLEVLPDDID